MKDIFTMGQEGKSADEIAKILKLPIKTVKKILGD
jgi:DNA-binding CsgD family transcriptional regulator